MLFGDCAEADADGWPHQWLFTIAPTPIGHLGCCRIRSHKGQGVSPSDQICFRPGYCQLIATSWSVVHTQLCSDHGFPTVVLSKSHTAAVRYGAATHRKPPFRGCIRTLASVKFVKSFDQSYILISAGTYGTFFGQLWPFS